MPARLQPSAHRPPTTTPSVQSSASTEGASSRGAVDQRVIAVLRAANEADQRDRDRFDLLSKDISGISRIIWTHHKDSGISGVLARGIANIISFFWKGKNQVPKLEELKRIELKFNRMREEQKAAQPAE